MKTTWVMQTNMGNQSDIKNYVDSVKETGAFVIEVNHIPFSQELQVDLTYLLKSVIINKILRKNQ